jgi:hypothetical protein
VYTDFIAQQSHNQIVLVLVVVLVLERLFLVRNE